MTDEKSKDTAIPAESECLVLAKEQIALQAQRHFDTAIDWLFKHQNDEASGEVLNREILINPTPEIISLANSWLPKFPKNKWCSYVLSSLLTAALTEELMHIAEKRLLSQTSV